MILFGASGHAKVVIDILEKLNVQIEYLVDANSEIDNLMGYEVIHDSKYEAKTKDQLIICIGNNQIRRKLVTQLSSQFGRAIHPSARLSNAASVGEGSVVMALSVINSSTSVGNHCIINTSASVDHDCLLEDYVHISPNATLCGNVKVGEGTQIGAGATVLPNINIGKWSMIGAGAIIVNDVPDYATVVGNPGKVIRIANV